MTFADFATASSKACGRPLAFGLATASIMVWIVTGPIFHFSDGWSLAVNTGTTIVTFLMVFLIQNTQNRDMAALHLKLDELISAIDGARNEVIASETLPEASIVKLKPRA